MGRKTQSLEKAQDPQQQGHSANDAKKPPEDLVMDRKVIPPKVKPGASEEQHRAAERDYWRRELRIMLWLNWITLVAVVGGIGSLIYIKKTLDATLIAADAARTQAQTAMKQLELSERPWVTADVTLLHPFKTTGDLVEFDVSLKNIGHGVAMNVRVGVEIMLYHWSKAFTLDWSPDEIEQRGRELCEDLRRRDLVEGGGLVLFPDQRGITKVRGRLEKVEVEERAFASPPDTNIYIDPIVIGCVAYQSTLTRGSRVTGFTFQISSANTRARHADGYIPVGDIIPLNEVSVRPYRYAEAYID